MSSHGYESQPAVGELHGHQSTSAYQQGRIDRKPVPAVSPVTVSTATPVQEKVELPGPGAGDPGYTHGYNGHEMPGQSRPQEMMVGSQRWELPAQ